MLTKGKFRTYDRLAVSDVRVTSCSAILGQKWGFAGIAVTRSVLTRAPLGYSAERAPLGGGGADSAPPA